MPETTALIVGAGIGGLAAALALSARGFPVTLVERRTRLTEIGAGLQLSPNATRVLHGLGLEGAIRRVATEPERVVVRRLESGREVGAVALGSFMRERFGAPYCVILRADLHTLLLDAVRARPDVRLMVGRTVTGIETGRDFAEVGIESATGARETLRADLVVGADGLRSTVREGFSDRQPVYRGVTAWRATVPRDEAPEELRGDDTGLWLGRGRHVVHYPVDGGRLVNIVAVLAGPEPSDDGGASSGPEAPPAAMDRAAAPLRKLLELGRDWSAWPLHDLPVQRMAKGRVALLGDAAHPVLPFLAQGAALAIEDAAVLARCLAEAKSPVRALGRYARLRSGRARKVQRQARRNGRIYHAGPLLALARDRVMAGLGPRRMAERYAWLYGWSPE